MKSVVFANRVGVDDGRPLPDALERLAAFHAKHPQSRRGLRKGQKDVVTLLKEARDRR